MANVLLALPAHAEAGKIFDFNLTLPVMVGQFLLLMVFLDKFWFGPVGKVLDERDAKIRSLLGDSKVRARTRSARGQAPLPLLDGGIRAPLECRKALRGQYLPPQPGSPTAAAVPRASLTLAAGKEALARFCVSGGHAVLALTAPA